MLRQMIIPGLLIAAASMHMNNTAYSYASDATIETPNYEITKSAGGVELRQYASRIVAQVDLTAASRDEASSKGFRLLAGYIFGQNNGKSKIAMTAPVTTTPSLGGDGTKIEMTAPVTTSGTVDQSDGTYTISFTMPAKWTLKSLPEPLDTSIKLIQEVPKKRLVSSFIGAKSETRIAKAKEEILSFAKSENIQLEGAITVAGYSGPSVPVSKRRWEVWWEAQ